MSLRMLLDGPDLRGIIKEVEGKYGRNFRVVKAEQVRTGGVAGFFAKQHYEVTVEISDPKLIARITGQPVKEPAPAAELATRSQNDQAAASAQAWAKDLLQKARELNELSVPVPAPQPQPARPRGVPLLEDDTATSGQDTKSGRGGKLRKRLPGKKKVERTSSDRMLRATEEQQSRLRELLAQGSRIVEDIPVEDDEPIAETTTTEVKTPAPKKPRKKTTAPKTTRKKSETPAAKATRKKKPTQAPADAIVEEMDAKTETSSTEPIASPEPEITSAPVNHEVQHVMEEPVMAQQIPAAPITAPAPEPRAPIAIAQVTEQAVPAPVATAPIAPAPVVAPIPAPVEEPAAQMAVQQAPVVQQVAAPAPVVDQVPSPMHDEAVAAEPDVVDEAASEDYWRSRIADEIRHQRDKVERFYARRGTVTEEEARNLKIFELAEAIARGRDSAPAQAPVVAQEIQAPAAEVAEVVDLDMTMEIPVVTASIQPVVEEAPARSPLNTGEILVLVGDAHEAYQQACAIIKECERPETHVFAVAPSSVTLPLLRAEEHFRHSDAYQVVDLVTELDVPAIVVVHAPMSMLLNEAEKVRVLQAITSLNSTDVWAVVDAAWRTEALHRWVGSLEGVSALVVTNEAECTDPNALTAIDIPVAFRDEKTRSMPVPTAKAPAKTIRIGNLPA